MIKKMEETIQRNIMQALQQLEEIIPRPVRSSLSLKKSNGNIRSNGYETCE